MCINKIGTFLAVISINFDHHNNVTLLFIESKFKEVHFEIQKSKKKKINKSSAAILFD